MRKWLKEFWEYYILLKDIELLDEAYMELKMDEKMGRGNE
jgi:hypothetical protein